MARPHNRLRPGEVGAQPASEASAAATGLEAEAWKIAQLAATLTSGHTANGGQNLSPTLAIGRAVALLTEARKRVAEEP